MAKKSKWVRLTKLYTGKYGKIGTLRGDNLDRLISMVKYVASADRKEVDGVTFATNVFDGDIVLSCTPAAPYQKKEKAGGDEGWGGEEKKKDDGWGKEKSDAEPKTEDSKTEEVPF